MNNFDIVNTIERKESLDKKVKNTFFSIVNNTKNFFKGMMNDCGNPIEKCVFVSYSFDCDEFIIHYHFLGMGNMGFCSYGDLRYEFLRVPFDVINDPDKLFLYCKTLEKGIDKHIEEKEEKVKQYYRDVAESERIRCEENIKGRKRIFSGNYQYLKD